MTEELVEKIARRIYELEASNRGCAVDWASFEWTPNMRKTFFPMARACLSSIESAGYRVVKADAVYARCLHCGSTSLQHSPSCPASPNLAV